MLRRRSVLADANGHRKLLEQLRADGIALLFGNPGSSEEGLLDELSRFSDIQYILGLQETAIVGIADGYAQATQKPAVVQLHCSVGLGNAIGSLYHAHRRGSPLLIIAGEAGVAYDATDAQMAADLVGMARPVTKYAARAIDSRSLLRLLRRCLKIAATPPFGPVFLSVPQDVLDAPNDEPVVRTVIPSTRVAPERGAIVEAARMLASAERPIILVGDGVAHSQAQVELAQLAELLGARVFGVLASEVNLPWTHPLFCGLTGHMFGYASEAVVKDADAVTICGTYVFPEVFPSLTNPFHPDAKIIHIDLDVFEIAKNHPITLGMVSDPKLTLRALIDAITEIASPDQKENAAARRNRVAAENEQQRSRQRAADQSTRDAVPLRMAAFAEELAKQLPDDAVIFDESLTNFPELLRWIPPQAPGRLFQSPGGTLGVGIPGAIGVKLACPQRTVVGFSGDGGAMYTYQALWTAAHYRIGAKLVVCNNRSYRLLKENLLDYWAEKKLAPNQFPDRFPPSFDILEPDIDFVGLAAALGVPGQRVTRREEIEPAITAMLGRDGPFLLDVLLDSAVPRPTS
jgi:thiamine pyrophosphate-dependent acetolactate synthase large subunit-like protein